MARQNLLLLEESLRKALVVRRGEYNYFIHPLTDTIPPLEPNLLSEICDGILKEAATDVDVIVTMEAMGIHIAAVLSQKTGIPFNVIRKRQYWLPGEIMLDQQTGYGKAKMYINGIKKGDRVLLVDAVVSTGGTLIAAIGGLRKAGAVIKDVVCVIEKGDGRRVVAKSTGVEVKTLARIEVSESGVTVLP